jgi:hypothetical protein
MSFSGYAETLVLQGAMHKFTWQSIHNTLLGLLTHSMQLVENILKSSYITTSMYIVLRSSNIVEIL